MLEKYVINEKECFILYFFQNEVKWNTEMEYF